MRSPVFRRLLRRQQQARGGDNPLPAQERREVHKARAAQALCLPAADHVKVQRAAFKAHMAHRAVHARHAAAYPRTLEGRARGHRAADKAAPAAEGHFSVGAHVEEEVFSFFFKQARGQQPRGDVPANIARDTGGKAVGVLKQCARREGRDRNGGRIKAREEVLHDGIARDKEAFDFL